MLSSLPNYDQLIKNALQFDNIIIGESSHGCHEFAKYKYEITKSLLPYIQFIVVEWDWGDCYKFNRYVKGYTNKLDFKVSRWPQFMWQNQETLDFIRYLRNYNMKNKKQVGFYGMDAFGLRNCLKELNIDPQDCDNEQNISANCSRLIKNIKQDNSKSIDDDMLNISICHDVVTTFNKSGNRWNNRENHMLDTIDKLKSVYPGKCIIMCHNTHAQSSSCIKDILMTLASHIPSYKIGMICDEGEILTADNWGNDPLIRKIDNSRSNSYENEIFNSTEKDLFILFRNNNIKGDSYRALGAIVKEDGYYFDGDLMCSFDSLICVRYITPILYSKPDTYH